MFKQKYNDRSGHQEELDLQKDCKGYCSAESERVNLMDEYNTVTKSINTPFMTCQWEHGRKLVSTHQI